MTEEGVKRAARIMDETASKEGDITLQEVVLSQVDESERTIYFFECIEPELLQRLVPTLHFMAAQSDEPITLECGSPGGMDGPMFALADAIESLRAPVDIKAYGQLSSAATVLLSVCRHRLVGENCQVLLHAFTNQQAADNYSTARELADALASAGLAARRWARLLARRTKRSHLPYVELLALALGERPEVRLVGAEIVDAGLADGLLHVSAAHHQGQQLELPLREG